MILPFVAPCSKHTGRSTLAKQYFLHGILKCTTFLFCNQLHEYVPLNMHVGRGLGGGWDGVRGGGLKQPPWPSFSRGPSENHHAVSWNWTNHIWGLWLAEVDREILNSGKAGRAYGDQCQLNSLDHFWVIKWLQVVPGKLELIRKSKSSKAHHVYLERVQLHPLFWVWKDCGSKHPPGDRLLSSRSHHISSVAISMASWESWFFTPLNPQEALRFLGLLVAEAANLNCSRSVGSGQGRVLPELTALSAGQFFNVHNPRDPHVHGFYSVTHTRLSMNLFVKSLMQKNPSYIERKDIKVWWAFALETQKLEFLFWLICQFAWCPWVSHEISLGPGFIISKKGNNYTTYLLGVLYKEQLMEVLESNL